MTISEAVRTLRRTKYRTAVYITEGEQVDIMRLKPPKRERVLNACLRDKQFARNFVGVYDRNISLAELREDIHFASQRQ